MYIIYDPKVVTAGGDNGDKHPLTIKMSPWLGSHLASVYQVQLQFQPENGRRRNTGASLTADSGRWSSTNRKSSLSWVRKTLAITSVIRKSKSRQKNRSEAPKAVGYVYQPTRPTRARRRPRRRWSDSVADTLRAHKISLPQAPDRRLCLSATPNSTSGRKN